MFIRTEEKKFADVFFTLGKSQCSDTFLVTIFCGNRLKLKS